MQVDLVGYLFNCLDPDEHRKTEEYVRANAEAQQRLEALQRSLEPLAADRDEIEPPFGLWVRALGKIAEHRCTDLPRAPVLVGSRSAAPPAHWWRRSDLLVAAVLLIGVVSLILPARSKIIFDQQKTNCRDNLRQMGMTLASYADMNNGEYPRVEKDPPRNVAGIYVPILRDGGYLGAQQGIHCPGHMQGPPPALSLKEVEQLHRSNPEEYERQIKHLSSCYAYPLGYQDAAGKHFGMKRDASHANNDLLPLMADAPPFDHTNFGRVHNRETNSPNHAGRGQNVLFVGGNVDFRKRPTVGVDGDHIFLNQNSRVRAGLHPWDSVLGSSGTRPYSATTID